MTFPVEWLVESLRFTAFLEEPLLEPAGVDWWSEVAGQQPSDIKARPREGRYQWHGEFNADSTSSAALSLQVEPLRADWNLACSTGPDDPLSFATIGQLTETLPVFLESLETWTSRFPACPRLALGGSLLLPCQSIEAAYELLSQLLPALEIDPKASRDLLYRINRPRRSETLPHNHPGINRISTWSVVTISSILMAIPGPVVDQQQGPSAARLEFDVNTIPNQPSLIPTDLLCEVSDELKQLVVEIAQNGDVP